jgi:hypothetical protein
MPRVRSRIDKSNWPHWEHVIHGIFGLSLRGVGVTANGRRIRFSAALLYRKTREQRMQRMCRQCPESEAGFWLLHSFPIVGFPGELTPSLISGRLCDGPARVFSRALASAILTRSIDLHRGRDLTMFTVWRGNSFTGVLVGRAYSLDEVIACVDMTGMGRYDVYKTGGAHRHWGFVTRNLDGTFTLKPDRLVTLDSWPRRASPGWIR